MPHPALRFAALSVAAFATSSFALTIPNGSILVSQTGGTSGSPSDAGASASIIVFGTNGGAQAGIYVSPDVLQLQGTRGGRLALSPDGKTVGLPGYHPPFAGSGVLSSRSSSDAPRGYVSIFVKSGVVSPFTTVKDLDAKAADSAVVDGDRAWLSGTDNLAYWDGSKTDKVFDGSSFVPPLQPKGIRAFEDRLFLTGVSTGLPSWVADFDGFPHGDNDVPRLVFYATNPADIAVTNGGNTVYVARSDGAVDVYKKDSEWSFKYRFAAPLAQLRGVAVKTSGPVPIVYAIDGRNLYKVTDLGKDATFQVIATAASTRAFDGIVVTPGIGIPELKLTSPKHVTTTNSVATIRGTAADADGLKHIRVKRGRHGAYGRATGKQTWKYRATLKPGPNAFFVQAVDTLGNKSKLIRVTIYRR